MKRNLLIAAIVAALSSSLPVYATDLDPYQDYRYCGQNIARDADGKIYRSKKVLAAFKKIHPCPVTGKTYGACPGWAIDHDWSLACGGCDAVFNLMWMRNEIKSCAADYCKDRYELKMFCGPYKKPPPTNLVTPQ